MMPWSVYRTDQGVARMTGAFTWSILPRLGRSVMCCGVRTKRHILIRGRLSFAAMSIRRCRLPGDEGGMVGGCCGSDGQLLTWLEGEAAMLSYRKACALAAFIGR